MLLNIPQHAYAWANAGFFQVFDGFGGGPFGGVGRTSHRHQLRPRHQNIEKNRCFYIKILTRQHRILCQIRCALHIVTTQERPVGGGKRGGILYLKKIYDTGFGVYTLLGKAQADY